MESNVMHGFTSFRVLLATLALTALSPPAAAVPILSTGSGTAVISEEVNLF